MTRPRLETVLWIVAGILTATAGLGATRSARGNGLTDDEIIPPARGASPRPAPGAERPQSVADHDPFRLERHPSPLAYKPELEGAPPAPPPPKAPRPPLVLAGILGGPPWEALIEGLPDKTGSVVVHAGDVFGDLKVRSVTRDSVIIRGADTTWRLGIKGSWQ
jgi:hypothetical protein